MSSTRNLAEAVALDRLGYPLESWVNDLRDEGQSWQTIARTLSDRTDRLIHVSWETLRVWYST